MLSLTAKCDHLGKKKNSVKLLVISIGMTVHGSGVKAIFPLREGHLAQALVPLLQP